MFVQKSLSLRKYFERKNSQTHFCCLCVNLPTVKIWGQSDKFPMSFSFLQWLLQVKKMIQENSAKYVNQTGHFYFPPKLKTGISQPIFNLFQWFLFCIRDFIWIITLTEKQNFKKEKVCVWLEFPVQFNLGSNQGNLLWIKVWIVF